MREAGAAENDMKEIIFSASPFKCSLAINVLRLFGADFKTLRVTDIEMCVCMLLVSIRYIR